jgi:hypothetical protein
MVSERASSEEARTALMAAKTKVVNRDFSRWKAAAFRLGGCPE